ncbi:MAG: phosphatidic acid phosphatase [Oscillospiraceae bacterium]|nr:phosphatidic acid phosphatase [Oscillospiraceae bacterium]
MRIRTPVVDYRKLRPGNLNTDEFRHVKLAAYWPIFGLVFFFQEKFYQVGQYFPVHCGLDDIIPFCEYFVVPYLLWFAYMVGMHLYTLLYDTEAFKRLMKFIMIGYTATLLIYFVFPTCQELRPVEYTRYNIFTAIANMCYNVDTNTNVCPSLHVVGSMGVMFTALSIKRFQTPGWRLAFKLATFVICVSTLFMRQHSVIDVVSAAVLSIPVYFIVFKTNLLSRRKGGSDAEPES